MVATDASNVFLKFIQKYYDTIVYQVTAKVEAQGGFTFESRAGRGPITFPGGVFKISDVRGNLGPSTFTRYSFLPIGGTSQDFGITLPLLICVDDCGTASETILAFQGELYFSVEAPNGAPPSMLVNGDLKMDGWWYNVLKAPFAHMGNVQLGIGFDMKVGIFPPTRIEAGGQICFGSKNACQRLGANDNYVHGAAYIGISASNPADNYFMGMITEVTVEKIFSILGDTINPKFYQWATLLPGKIAQSGIEPFHQEKCDAAKAGGLLETEEIVDPLADTVGKTTATKTITPSADSNQAKIDKNCYAYISFSPIESKELRFRSGTVFIDQGIGMSGRINILGYRVGVEAQISKTRFYVNVEMDKLDLKVLKIGARLNSKNQVEGNPKFLMDFNAMPPSAVIQINGAFEIPILQTYARFTFSSTRKALSSSRK